MKTKILLFFLLPVFSVLAKKSTLTIENNFYTPIKITILRGGTLDQMPDASKVVAEEQIDPFSLENFEYNIKNAAIFWVTIVFENGSKYVYDPIKLKEEDRFTITIELDDYERVDSSENYYKDLRNDFYGGINTIVERDIDNKSDIFKSLYRGLTIARVKTTFFNREELSRVNYLRAEKLERNLNVGFKKTQVKNFNYVISDSMLREKIAGIPGIAGFRFSNDPSTLYDINYAVTGLQNYDSEAEKSIEDSWNEIEDPIDRDLFLRNFTNAVMLNQDINNQRIEVREYNNASGFKGMYVRIDEYAPNPKNPGDDIVFITEKGPYYLKSEKYYQDIYGESILAIGFKGDDKTKWIAGLANEYVDKLKTNVRRTNTSTRKEILNELGVQGYEKVNQEEYLAELDIIKEKLTELME